MSSSTKDLYEKSSEYKAFYTGGDIQWTDDGSHLLCMCNDAVQVVDINSCSSILSIGCDSDSAEEDTIYTFALSRNNDSIVTAHKSGLIKVWDKNTGNQVKMWRSGHKGPVARLAYNYLGDNLASGGSDGSVRLWNLNLNTCVSSLKGASGVFSVLKFYSNSNKQLVFGAADDTKIRSWHLNGKENVVYSGHFSKVTAIEFSLDGEHMVSSGRDRVLILWNLNESKALRTVPVYESIEGIFMLPQSFKIPNFKQKLDTKGIFVACAGEKGSIKVYDVEKSIVMYEQTDSLVSPSSTEGGLAITGLLYNEVRNRIAMVSADHNIIIYDLETFKCDKQLIGFTDEILDLIFVGKDESHIVVATNSADLKYYNNETMDCKIIKGHTDIVLSLAKFPTRPEVFVSSGKDNSVRVWIENDAKEVICIGIGNRHTASVGSLCTAQVTHSFFASVSQDNCLKIWTTPNDLLEANQIIKTKSTELAHQADINCVCISPNDKMLATGSQDKTAKLWSDDLSLLGVLRGHRRGVWCVKFSPVDQVLLSCSADCSIKLWSISDLNCLKTLEGHDSSVLKIEFLSRGQQIISSGADGLLKLWNIKSSECKMSLDNHDGKVWAMVVNKDESKIITGGSDSKLVKWKDVTTERKEQLSKEREEFILQEQELMNLLHDKKMVKALKLAIRLGRPMNVLKIINEVLKDGNEKLYETLKEINDVQKESLLKFAAEWNTNNKTCHAAQIVFNILAPEIISGSLNVSGLASFIEGALPYSERHFERLTNLLQDLQFITYTVNCMQAHTAND